MDDFAELVERFLQAPKRCVNRSIRWRTGNHPDYAVARLRLLADGFEGYRTRVEMAAHLKRDPRKFQFALLFNNTRVLALDVGPARSHKNLLTGKSISCSHWQVYPLYEAEADDRTLTHRIWLDEFCKRAHIDLEAPYRQPPFDKVQLGLSLK
ncbi:hypothetical protein HL658_08155 [Azospirillum sp. RWY-5-1]|uniref:Uncharacterized protein n=1 Tax=Azospirillum oleiclasticum TaxID=2735135 RepID=A0ABX2T5S3_9PROT|nr:hypothetical protein [Azospirillum oleiclasticum]NYZ12520.1 hypothetical protein [Azospirillum oleiclasticum]NYZ19680.1 hypothetical protein [Azospirillum oleiclasticum]